MIKMRIVQIKPKVIYWEKSGHILTLGPEREQVIQKIQEFLQGFESLGLKLR